MRINEIISEDWLNSLKSKKNSSSNLKPKFGSNDSGTSLTRRSFFKKMQAPALGAAGAMGLGLLALDKLPSYGTKTTTQEVPNDSPNDPVPIDKTPVSSEILKFINQNQMDIARQQLVKFRTKIQPNLIKPQEFNYFASTLLTAKLRDKPNSSVNELTQFLAQTASETQNYKSFVERTGYSTPEILLETYCVTITGKQYRDLTLEEKQQGLEIAKQFTDLPDDVRAAAIANYMMAKKQNTDFGDGWDFRGRGIIHLTGRANYDIIGKKIGVDLVNNPDVVATDLSTAIKSGLAFWNFWVAPKIKNDKEWANTYKVTRIVKGSVGDYEVRQDAFVRLKSFVQKYLNDLASNRAAEKKKSSTSQKASQKKT